MITEAPNINAKIVKQKGIYGDASDGNVVISTTSSLSRDMFYESLVLTGAGNLDPNGFRIWAHTEVFVSSSAEIQRKGNDGTTSVAGAAMVDGSISGSQPGGNGGVSGSAGSNGLSANGSHGGSGGAGGTSDGVDGGAGGAAGVATAPDVDSGGMRAVPQMELGHHFGSINLSPQGGGGGGGGGSSGSVDTFGGAGAGGGGFIIINALKVVISGSVSVNGGNGANGSNGTAGGGGGGGAGAIAIVTSQTIIGSDKIFVSGGIGGAAVSTGTAGSNGNSGSIFTIEDA